MKRVDEQSSAVSPVPQSTTPRGIDRWAAFAWFLSLGVSTPPIHSSRSAYAQLESHSKEDCFHAVQDPFDKHVALSAMGWCVTLVASGW